MKSKYTATLFLALIFFSAWPRDAVPSQERNLIQYQPDRGTVKKEIPLSQVASRDLLLEAQKELKVR